MKVVYTLTNATFENATINMNLTLRNQNTQTNKKMLEFLFIIKNKLSILLTVLFTTFIIIRAEVGPFSARSFADFIYSYLNGTLRKKFGVSRTVANKMLF